MIGGSSLFPAGFFARVANNAEARSVQINILNVSYKPANDINFVDQIGLKNGLVSAATPFPTITAKR